jgi:hypothetical protein
VPHERERAWVAGSFAATAPRYGIAIATPDRNFPAHGVGWMVDTDKGARYDLLKPKGWIARKTGRRFLVTILQ